VHHLAQNFQTMSSRLQGLFETLEQRVAERTRDLHEANASLKQEQAKAEQLLLNILPGAIASKLKESPGTIAELFEEVTILFADIVDFTPLSNRMEPLELVSFLNRVFSTFDALAEKHGLEKIKTIGDAYMVVAGLPTPREDHARAIADMALEMQSAVRHITDDLGAPCEVRIGINSGIVVAGVIGTSKFIYDLWGDAVNVASRMESHGAPGRIHLTASTYEHLKDSHDLIPRGSIYIKGKGQLQTYWLLGRTSSPALRLPAHT
jgi:adenylate cyclase